jgi:hypothetical protein
MDFTYICKCTCPHDTSDHTFDHTSDHTSDQNVHLTTHLTKCTSDQKYIWPNVHLTKCSSDQMFIWPNVHLTKCSSDQMYIWPNVHLTKCTAVHTYDIIQLTIHLTVHLTISTSDHTSDHTYIWACPYCPNHFFEGSRKTKRNSILCLKFKLDACTRWFFKWAWEFFLPQRTNKYTNWYLIQSAT